MYAVVEVGSIQFKVAEGDSIDVQRFECDDKKAITLQKVLMYENGSDIRIGQPYLKDVKVSAEVKSEFLAPKVIAFKFRRKKRSGSKIGHRQKLVTLVIKKISA
jgi:large subunit ribosomal protein L21